MKRTREYGTKTPARYQKRRYAPPTTSTAGVSQRSYVPLARRGYRLNNVEKKSIDTAMSATITNGGQFYALCVPVPGAGMSDRVGRKLTMKSLYIRGTVQVQLSATPSGSVTSEAHMLRLIVLYDKQPNGALPALADILGAGGTVNSMFNIDNRDRFQILKDKTWAFDPMIYDSTNDAYAWNRCIYPVKIFKKINLETIFNAGTAGTSADINSGNLIAFWIENAAAAADKNVNIYTNARVRYVDV